MTALSLDSMDRGAWPFFVDGVTCLVNSVSMCKEKREERREKREERREKREERREKREERRSRDQVKRRDTEMKRNERKDNFFKKKKKKRFLTPQTRQMN